MSSIVRWLFLGVLVTACGRDEYTCPPGASWWWPDPGVRKARMRVCMRPGSIPDGPAVMIDVYGREHLLGRWVSGKRQGTWRTFHEDGRLVTEVSYRDGRVDGTTVDWYPELQVRADEAHWRDGLLEGLSRSWNTDGRLTSLAHWRRGRLHGVSERYGAAGEVISAEVYDDGILTSIDGRSVPPPPERIELPSGRVEVRSECPPEQPVEARSLQPSCIQLFARVQRCALEHDEACRTGAVKEYDEAAARATPSR